eukprot:TRINITY_DN15174_c0_g1_i1.p1 TRINITY_DN15174_c0_g1~~TRINITY_DN15174_c0_g1_i1.p1  ORF type:complete len:156 (-),score=30.64 TRINITY_DN15174_c0_g1_i1:249-647(-)
MQNANTKEDLNGLLNACFAAIDQMPAVPSVQMQHTPASLMADRDENCVKEEIDPDVRGGGIHHPIKPGDESDDEGYQATEGESMKRKRDETEADDKTTTTSNVKTEEEDEREDICKKVRENESQEGEIKTER